LTFAGIGLTNAQVFEMSVGEFKQNKVSVLMQSLFARNRLNLSQSYVARATESGNGDGVVLRRECEW